MPGLYIHIPFCIQKCSYCDFISFPNSEEYHTKYIDMLAHEMEGYKGSKIDTVFIGGGTPTILKNVLLEKLCRKIKENFVLTDDCEFTVEANPKTLNGEKLKTLKNGGVNRLSIGVQSFNDDELSVLGRIHNAADAYNTVCMAKNMGFENINVDLMSALPSQTYDKLKFTLEKAVSLEPTHISCYSLILEDGTLLEKKYSSGKITVPNEDDDRKMYSMVCEYLAECGYEQYEISNFAKKGYECRHNIKYWECNEYIGLGVAAHSYMNKVRFYNTNSLKEYLDGNMRSGETVLTDKDLIEEFMIMGFRMTRGIAKSEFERRFNMSIDDVYGDILDKHIKNGFIIYDSGYYKLSKKGIDVSNSVLCDFIF